MWGAFFAESGEYRACAEVEADEDLGLPRNTLPGVRYLRTKLRGEPPELYTRIPTAFEALARDADSDPGRPSLEFYRRRDEVVLLLPIRG
jgi:hypothetical protein